MSEFKPRHAMKMLILKIFNQHYNPIRIFHKTRASYIKFSYVVREQFLDKDQIQLNLYPILSEIFPTGLETGRCFITYPLRENNSTGITEYRSDVDLNRPYVYNMTESDMKKKMIQVDAYKIYNALVEEPSNHLMHHVQ
jgi:hypothetical protein